MKSENAFRRFIFQTKGVCPPEIHFQLNGRLLEEVRFVGGGCPGNATLVSRLLKGRLVDEVLPVLKGITCREKTSCPDQLSVALTAAIQGNLSPADTIRIQNDAKAHDRVAFLGALNGNCNALSRIMEGIDRLKIETACCIGNFSGTDSDFADILKRLRSNKKIVCLQGERDWSNAYESDGDGSLVKAKDRDWIAMLPQMMTFRLGTQKAVAFFGDYLQTLPGYSDFAPYALEINMVCGLADFMRDETVFPALEAMTPQFQSDVVLFGQREEWGQWRVGGKEFISIGRSHDGEKAAWGVIELTPDGVHLEVLEEKL